MQLLSLVVGQSYQHMKNSIIPNMTGVMDKNTVSKHYCKSCGDENHCGRINYNEDGTVKCGICKCAVCHPRKKQLNRG